MWPCHTEMAKHYVSNRGAGKVQESVNSLRNNSIHTFQTLCQEWLSCAHPWSAAFCPFSSCRQIILASAAVDWNPLCKTPFCQRFCALQSAAQTLHMLPVHDTTPFRLFSSLILVHRNCVRLRLPEWKWHLSDLFPPPSANQQQAGHCLCPLLNILD